MLLSKFAGVKVMHASFFKGIRVGTILFKRFMVERCDSATAESGVFQVRDLKRDTQRVILKTTYRDSHLSFSSQLRLENEYEVSKRIRHPNVVRCFSFHREDSFSAFSMEYLPNGNLGDKIKREGPQPIPFVFKVLLQMVEALKAVHDHGIIHRDIKPENILLTKNNASKLSDFGIAAVGRDRVCGSDEVLLGTLDYLSPEYIESGWYDERSDLYALGMVGYKMLAGTLPEFGEGVLDRLVNKVRHPMPDILKKREGCPLGLVAVISRAVALEASARYSSALEMLVDLQEALSEAAHPCSKAIQCSEVDSIEELVNLTLSGNKHVH